MSRRTKEDYVQVLDAVFGLLDRRPMVEWVMLDFEAASWQAFRQVLPGRVLKGCVFHWAQRVYRKITMVGLATAYQQKADKYAFLRKLMTLPYLPTEHVEDAFQRLQDQAEDVGWPVLQVTQYVQSTWIDGRVWQPENWNVFRQPIRTNNDVEGWHRRINGKGGRPDLPLYVILPLLKEEATFIRIQMMLVSENLLTRTHRKRYANIHGKLLDAWDKYENGETRTTDLLRVCSRISGLGVTPTRDPIYHDDAF